MIVRLTMQCAAIGLGVIVVLADDGIEGSKHDFSQKGWSQGQLCGVCHTPHSSGPPTVAPLWDHSQTARTSYKMFDGRPGMPGAGSLLCLSCHDGGTALDAYGEMTGEAFIQDIDRGRSQIGENGDLSTNHPVGVKYPEHDKFYRPKAEVEDDGAVTLPRGQVECLSCHDVHNSFGHDKLLVKTNDRSALCLTCHRK